MCWFLLALFFRPFFSLLRAASVFPYCFDGYFPQNLCLLLFDFSPSSLYNLASLKIPKERNWYKCRNNPTKKLKEVFFLRKKKNHPTPRNCADQCAINEILDLLAFSSFSPPTTKAHQPKDVLNHGQLLIFRIIKIFAKILSGSELRLAKKKTPPPWGFSQGTPVRCLSSSETP